MSWQKTWRISVRVSGGLAATLLTAAALLYAPIGLGAESSPELVVRPHVIWAMVAISAAATWVVAIETQSRTSRFICAFAAGFNGIWIFSFVGLPVVVASLVAVLAAAGGVRKRLGLIVVAVAAMGLALGLLLMRLTEPPGEHIFG